MKIFLFICKIADISNAAHYCSPCTLFVDQIKSTFKLNLIKPTTRDNFGDHGCNCISNDAILQEYFTQLLNFSLQIGAFVEKTSVDVEN